MPLCSPRPAVGGFWREVEDYADENFALEMQAGLSTLFSGATTYRIVLVQSMIEVARADSKEEAIRDWKEVHSIYEAEIKLVGSTKFSAHHLLAVFEALWEQRFAEASPARDEVKIT